MSTRPEVAPRLTRAALLGRATVAVASVGLASRAPYAFAGPLKYSKRALKGELSIVQWNHVVSAYDDWFDKAAAAWGETNDVHVTVDHVPYPQLPSLAAAEAKTRRGHDIFGFLSPPAAHEDDVIDHSSIVSEIERSVGAYGELGRNSTFNPKTNTYVGVSDSYVPAPVLWRHDLWNPVGESPATWDHVANAAPKLRTLGHPIGIGQSNELDSNTALASLMMCFGAFLQDESNALAFDADRVLDAVEFVANLYTQGQGPEVFGWNPASNNEALFGGRASMIVNAISALRTAEDLQLPFVDDLWLWPIPAGPQGRVALGQWTSVYSVWNFSQNRDAAERFIADLCIGYRQGTIASRLFNMPSFPGAFPPKQLRKVAASDPNAPRGKYTVLATVASHYTANLGYPGTANAAVAEVFDRYLIPQMFAAVSQGKLSATDSVGATTAELKRVWAKWRAAGKL
jgi:multiple sugar transport system substrate-binding protein